MNYELAYAVRARIIAEPKHVNMNHWCASASTLISEQRKSTCGTVGCIAGHTLYAVGISVRAYEKFDFDVSKVARALLGLSNFEAHRLFYFMNFVEEDLDPYDYPYVHLARQLKKQRAGTQRYAQIVARAIDLCVERHVQQIDRDVEVL